MNLKILGLLAVGLLAGPLAANAGMVTWNYRGAWDVTGLGVTQSPLSSLPSAGTSFQLSISFDTDAPYVNTCDGSADTSCKRYSASSLSFALTSPSCIGGVCNSSAFVTGEIQVGNDTSQSFGAGPGGNADFIFFRLVDNNNLLWRALFATGDLSKLSGTFLPSSDPGIRPGDFKLCADPARFASCGQDYGTAPKWYVDGTLLPEPGTLALLGLGLAGLGLSRRRKAH